MEDEIESLFEDIPTKRRQTAQRRPVPEIEKTRIPIPFDELKNKRIVITGRLFQMKRDEFKLWLSQKGAQMQSSVSSHTDLLVVGKKPGGVKVSEAFIAGHTSLLRV